MRTEHTSQKASEKFAETYYKNWELRVSIVAATVSLIGLLVTSFFNLAAQNSTAKQEKRQANQPFYDKQLDLYLQASGAVATMATLSTKEPAWKNAYCSFQTLYRGGMYTVESENVKNKMVEINQLLSDSAVPGDVLDGKPIHLSVGVRNHLADESLELARLMEKDTEGWRK